MKVGNREFRSCSYFSRPGGGRYQLGTGAPAPGNLISWQAQQIRQTKDTWEGSVTTEKFRLHRVIRLSGQRIEVEDALAYISNADLGWMIRDEVALPPDAPAAGVHLGGDNRTNPSPVYARVIKDGSRIAGIDCWRPANPTVYVPFPDCGIGMVMEDSVMRIHGALTAKVSASASVWSTKRV